MKKAVNSRSIAALTLVSLLFFIMTLAAVGCGEESQAGQSSDADSNTTATTPKGITRMEAPGIVLDPSLKSVTGVPAPEEMKALIGLQAAVPYPLIVPTSLPGDYSLDKELIAFGVPTERDPIGYYSFRYSDPSSVKRVLTFNQSQANDKPLSGYYLTKFSINGTNYDVYWHENRNYLPDGPPVETDEVGVAEAYVIVWKGKFTDGSGQTRELFYSLTTGTNTGHDWEDIKSILASLKPLESVGQ